jgi:hypothetical protein
MANKRTVFPIPANAWTRVVNGATAAKLHKSKQDVTYYSMTYTAGTDTPTGTIASNPTAEKMFTDSGDPLNEFVSDAAAVYLWVRCAEDEVGSIIVTL